MRHDETIHLAIAFDENYLIPFYTLLTSVFLNNRQHVFHFHVIATGISKTEIEEIEAFIGKHQSKISFYTIGAQHLKDLVVPEELSYTLAAYYKLFFPQFVCGMANKLLYLDTDTVVNGDLSELYETDLGYFPVAVVPELFNKVLRLDLGISETGIYFNSGVLLINVPEWQNQKITEKTLAFIRDFPGSILWVDQDALNAVIRSNYVPLKMTYNLNTMDVPRNWSKTEYRAFAQDKIIIHYTTESKPWNVLTRHRLRFLYFDYLKRSPKNKPKYLVFRPSLKNIIHFLKSYLKEGFYNFPLTKILRTSKA